MIADLFAFYGKSYVLNFLTGDLERNIIAVVNKYTVMFACYIERNIFIGNLRSCTAVLIPYIYYLSILYECCKSLSKSIDAFTWIKRKLCYHIWLILCCHVVWLRELGQCSSVILHVSKITESNVCKNFFICFISDLEIFQINSYSHSSGFHHSFIFCDLHLCFLWIFIQFISWFAFYITFIMIASYTDDIFTYRSKFCSDSSYIQGAASVCDLSERRNDSHSSRNCFCCKCLRCIGCICSFIFLPISLCKFHLVCNLLFYKIILFYTLLYKTRGRSHASSPSYHFYLLVLSLKPRQFPDISVRLC